MPNHASPIHPDLQEIARKSPKIEITPSNLWLYNLLVALVPAPKSPGNIHVENISIPGNDGNLRLRLYRPKSASAPTPVLVWLHGGGYLIGKPEMDDPYCAELVQQLGITIVSVDYRRAPKHPFPAALEDAYTALEWVVAQAQEQNLDASRLAIGGNSAGAGLAASLAQLAHDRGAIRPVFQLLIYPMLDDRTALRTDLDDINNLTWTQNSNRFGWESYLGMACGTGKVPAYAVPARRKDLSGLAPAWLGVGTLDLFHAENVAYAQHLKESNVDCELVVIPGAFHGFDVIDRQAPLVQEFRKSQIAALKKYLRL